MGFSNKEIAALAIVGFGLMFIIAALPLPVLFY